MKGGTLFSGIGAPECAAPWIDWRWCAEIDRFPAAVHAARFPGVTNLGDVTKVRWDDVEAVDLVVWGSPCQAFSVAGRRAGLDDPRGDLTLVGLAALGRILPRWMVWENVPGVLSIDRGRTFGTVLGLMGQLGYGVAYRVLDAQHFGVPQRRRRVFVVGCLGDWRAAAAVLFERDCLSGHPPARGEAREDVAAPLAAGTQSNGGYRNDADTAENLIADTTQVTSKANYSNPQPGDPCHPLATGAHAPAIAHCLNAHPSRRIDGESETFVVQEPTAYRVTGNDGAYETRDHVGALGIGTDQSSHAILEGRVDAATTKSDAASALRALQSAVGEEAFAEWRSRILDPLQSPEILRAFLHGGSVRRAAREGRAELDDGALPCPESVPAGPLRRLWEDGPDGRSPQGRELAQQLARQLGATLPILPHQSASPTAVRRLMPVEAERLQGFPDQWTAVTYRGKPAADGPRYKALGNSMAVPVLAWLLDRIRRVDAIKLARAA